MAAITGARRGALLLLVVLCGALPRRGETAPRPANASAAAPPRQAGSAGPPTRFIRVDEIEPGMTGYGLTVFQGTRPERFAVKVIGVLRNFLPQQDVILVESDDARLKHTGIIAGMSGSPIYLLARDGPRLAGALAYGWQFAKDPIAGVTPIESMLAEMRRPLRGREHTPVAEAALDPTHRPVRRPVDAAMREPVRGPMMRGSGPGAPDDRFARREPPARDAGDLVAPTLRQVAVPLAVSGFEPAAFDQLKRLLEPWGITAVAAGGGSPASGSDAERRGPARFEPGAAISVQLIRGDMSAAGTGTVTYVEGDKVAAFGHPLLNLGEIYLPIATAEVHTVLASLSSSFKIASPLREVGTLVQDRQACVVGDTGQRSDMIPVSIKVGSPGRPERAFQVEVIRHRFLTPMLASAVVGNVAQAAASDVADATITVRTALGVRGYKPLELVDHAFSNDGFSARTMGALAGMKAIGEILFNPFSPASLERIDVQVEVEYRADVAEVTGLQLGADALDPGSRPSLRVTLRPYNGPEYVESVPIAIPRALAGTLVKIEAAAGNLVKPPIAAPESFGDLMDNLRKSYPARSIVVTLQEPDDGLALRGSVMTDLPPSVLDTLRPGASTRRGETFKETARIVVPTRNVVVGKQEIQVKIKDESPR